MAVKFGVLDTVRILLQQGGDKSKYVLFQTFKNSTFIKKMLKLKKQQTKFLYSCKKCKQFYGKIFKNTKPIQIWNSTQQKFCV